MLVGILQLLAPAKQVFAAPHLEPCKRDEYQATVEQLVRRAWHEPMGLLIIMYGVLPERGIGLTKNDDGYRLIRIEFDKSLWYNSWISYDNEEEADLSNAHGVSRTIYREDGGPLGIQVLDFSKTEIRPSTTSIPISDTFASTLTQVLEESADAAREESSDIKILDGYSYEFLMRNRSCARLHSPGRDTEAWRIAELVRLLAAGAQSWRTWNEEETEVRAIDLIDQLSIDRKRDSL